MSDFRNSIGVSNTNFGIRIGKTPQKKISNSLLDLNRKTTNVKLIVTFRFTRHAFRITSSGGSGPTNLSFLHDQ